MNFKECFPGAWKQSIFSVLRLLSSLPSVSLTVSLSHWLFSDLNSTSLWSLCFVLFAFILNSVFYFSPFQISFSFCLSHITHNFIFHCVPIFYFKKNLLPLFHPSPPHWQSPVCPLCFEVCFLVSLFFFIACFLFLKFYLWVKSDGICLSHID